MADVGIDAFEKSLKEGVRPIYTLVGDQPFMFDMLISAIKDACLEGAFADMNFDTVHGSEKGATEKVLNLAQQFPMMASRRMVLFREADKINKQETEQLAEYLLNPSDFCCLALCFSKLAKNTKVWKRSQKNGMAMSFEKVYERQMPFWLKRMASRYDKKISPSGINFLVRSVGADLTKANAELEKASLFAGTRKTIEAEDIEAVLASVKVERIFDLTDALGKKNKPQALYLIGKMLEAGDHPIGMLAQIGRHMKRLMLVRSLLASGAPASQIGRAMGVMDFVRDKLVAQANVFSRKELRRSLVLITQTDLELKSGRVSNRAILEKLTLDLCAK